jgi:hypothetical protein
MNKATHGNRHWGWVLGAMTLASLGLTGCQVDIAGQTLPSPYYLTDDVQYYAPGPEFKLAKEAAALKADREAYESQGQPCCP